jgi:hypothetical protein
VDRKRQKAIEAMPTELRVAKMRGFLKNVVEVSPNNTNAMAAFINLYNVHAPTTGEDFDRFLEQLDRPDAIFTEHTFDTVVYRYDDLKSGKSPEEATPIEFDPLEAS